MLSPIAYTFWDGSEMTTGILPRRYIETCASEPGDMKIRIATTDDAAAIREIYAPYVESTAITFEVEPPSVAAMAEQIAAGVETYPWLVCESGDGELVGYAAASQLRSKTAFQWSVELSIYVDSAAQGNGIGTALYTALLDILAEQGFFNAYVAITLPNEASVALHERLGFEAVGTFPGVGHKRDAWHDVQWWARTLGERPSDPDPPKPFETLRGSPAIERAIDAGQARLEQGE